MKKSSFILAAFVPNPLNNSRWSVFATCSSCHLPIASRIRSANAATGQNPNNFPGDLAAADSPWVFFEIFPQPSKIQAPANVPDGVAKAFTQAAESRKGGHFDAAAAMYRKAMELSLKALSPEIEAWKIEKRIDKMAAQGLITTELKDWAHELRLDGNDVLHEDEATLEMINQMHALCTFLLTYLYTLPEQVKAARERRAGQS